MILHLCLPSVCLSRSMAICLYIHLSFCASDHLLTSRSVCFFVSACPPTFLSVCLSVYQWGHSSVHLSVCMLPSVSLLVCLSVLCVLAWLPVCLPFCLLSAYLFILRPSVWASICPSSIGLSLHLSLTWNPWYSSLKGMTQYNWPPCAYKPF